MSVTAPLHRVAPVTALFWVVKLLTTGTGEAASDFLVRTFDPVAVVLVAVVATAGCLVVQLTARRYSPWRYWLLVAAIAVVGTMVADVAHVVLDVPYLLSSVVLAAALALVLGAWRAVEGTTDVSSVDSVRRELLYWTTVLVTFALGTALGDLAATAGLGFDGATAVFLGLFVLAAAARRAGLPGAVGFWTLYVLTRPLGASVADWLAVSHSRGGLALGAGPVSLVGALLTVACVALITAAGRSRGRGRRARRRIEVSA